MCNREPLLNSISSTTRVMKFRNVFCVEPDSQREPFGKTLLKACGGILTFSVGSPDGNARVQSHRDFANHPALNRQMLPDLPKFADAGGFRSVSESAAQLGDT